MSPSKPPIKRLGKNAPGLRQTMSNVHTWTGLTVGWLLYAMFLTGTVSYFRSEISQWMRPELSAQKVVLDAAESAERIVSAMSLLAPESPQWSFDLPGERNSLVTVSWRNPQREGRRSVESATINPATGQRVNARDTVGGSFFYYFHFQFHYLPRQWGRWIAGFCAMFMLVAIISGVITHKKIFADFFTFRWGKGQRSWLDAHNALSVFGLPFHLMITYSGLVTLMLLYMPWSSNAAFKTPVERQALTVEMSSFLPPGKPSGEKAESASIADMVQQAQQRWGAGSIGRVTINHRGDEAARVVIMRGDFERVSVSPKYLLFDGVSGKLLRVKEHVGPAAETYGVLYALHLGRFADITVRWLYFIVSLAGTAMVGTGLVLWIVKRRAKLPNPERPHLGFHAVERLNIAAIAGLSIAMTAFLWGNRLLPVDIGKRAEWEIHLFFIVWGAAFLHAALRPAKRAWLEQLSFATVLLALLPMLNAMATGRGVFASIAAGDWVFAGFDLTLLALAALHATLAMRVARHKPKVKSTCRTVMQIGEEAA